MAAAAERVYLQNGFSVDCTRREQISETRTRLFLGASSTDFIEVDTPSIASFSPLPTETADVHATSGGATASLPALVATIGKEHGIQTALLMSVIQAESGGRERAVSHAGALGLMQLMPGTARELGVKDSFAPEQNVRGGTAYLDTLLRRYHDDMALALAAYNAGPAAVDRYRGVPPYRETRIYVARIIREFNRRVLAERASAASAATVLSGASVSRRNDPGR